MTKVDNVKQQALDSAMLQIEKQFGKGSISRLGDTKREKIPAISTGSLELDIALGVGGVPRGRIIEIYGPESTGKTTMTLNIISQAQRTGGICAFIDAEHALDPIYASKIGVDIDNLIVSQPDTGEEALEICETLVTSKAVDVIVIDSVASLVPKAEIEGDMGASHMGLQARLMSQAMRKLTGIISKSNTCVIFINQIRMKIGVMFGCFSYDTKIQLADGTTENIGKIVNQKLPIEVLSYNFDKKCIESKKIVNWYNNGISEKFLKIKSQRGKSSGQNFMEVTPNHMIFTPEGEKSAEELNIGDIIYTISRKYLNDDQRDIAIGSILGDGSLRCKGVNTQLRIGHGKKQNEYCEEKRKMFNNAVGWTNINSQNGLSFDLHPSYDLTEYFYESYSKKGRIISNKLLSNLNLRSIAIWYMDDGTFSGSYSKWGKGKCSISLKSYSFEDINKIINRLIELGLPEPKIDKHHRLNWFGENCFSFQEKISKFILPCMNYKIHPKLRNNYDNTFNYINLDESVLAETKITSIQEIYKKENKYDIEIEDNHNYFAGGMLVHNSPETTTGGNALKFYSSVRLDIRRIETLKNGDDAVGNRVRVKVVKNKVAPPFKQAEFDIMFEDGISKESSILDLGVKYDIINKAGTWYSYKEERIGQGKENCKKWLQENNTICNEIERQIKEKSGILFEANENSFSAKAQEIQEKVENKRKPRSKTVDNNDVPENVDQETGEVITDIE